MSEKTPQPSFELLSDAMVRAKNHESVQGWPVVRQWIARNLPSELDDGLADEEKLLDTAGAMLARTEMFLGEPEPVKIIREAYERAMADKQAYLKYALPVQADKLFKRQAGMVAQERLLRNLERGIDRREGRATNALDRLSVIDDPTADALALLSSLVSLSKNARLALIATQEAQGMTREADKIRALLSLKPRVEQLLAETQAKVDLILAAERRELTPTLTKAAATTKGGEHVKSGSKRRHLRALPVAGDEQTDPKLQQTAEKKLSQTDVTVAKIREVIDADPPPPVVRLITTQEKHRNRFIPAWEKVFRALEYAGEIQFVYYSELAGDTQTPVFIPRKMVAGKGRWNLEKYKVVVLDTSSPNLVSNHITASSAREE